MTVALSTCEREAEEQDAEIIELRPALSGSGAQSAAGSWQRWLPATVALLALPLAVALTVWVMSRPALEARRPIGFSAPVLRVAVMAAPETTSVARRVASTLSTDSTEITFEADAAVDSAVTRVVYYAPEHADEAAQVQKRLGAGTLLLGSVLEERSADVTVVVGKDLAPA